MPAYHSIYNEGQNRTIGNIAIIQPTGNNDIIDEALSLFRANTFFRNFDIKGGGDRILIYLTLYIQECLTKLSKLPSKVEGGKLLATLAVTGFPLPGDSAFPLNSVFEKPASRQDIDALKTYFTQLRVELGNRLIERIYEGDVPSKWWMCFSKRKFMGLSGVGTYQ